MHRKTVRPIALVAGLLGALPLLAQGVMPTIENSSGRVFVKRGDGYLPVTADTVLEPTDSLMLLEGASASLNCNGTTLTSFNEAGVYSIPQCPAQVAAATPAGAAPAASSATAPPAPAGGAAAASEGVSKGWLIAGGVGAAALVAVAAGGGGGDNDKPASP